MSDIVPLDQLLAQFAVILVPFGEEIGAPSASVASADIAASIKPFAALFGVNILALSLRHYILRVGLGLLEMVAGFFIVGLLVRGPLRRRSKVEVLRARMREQQARAKSKRETRDQTSFQSWDQLCRGTVFWCFGGELSDEARNALSVLGVTAFATHTDLRKAYLDLMKKYHPDRFIHKPEELEQAQMTTIKVREAYDMLSKRLCQAQ